ncbi:hypothetical protein [Formosa maritima]|uniref:STAS domain-containing protein n=1 Tax=Formosa maritima TaxID=2592046 RepID=A0A5D0G2M2_9FLAO|nr:hypothetical protein [Formosa maritima]TYA53075.1 hypothetical protein FVF61_10455 [Formosa maritima]
MNLTITHYNNFFKVKGILNRQSVGIFQKEFQDVFEKLNAITISIEGIESIDRDGVNALAKLHNESIIQKKQLSIIGFGCKDLYEHFKSNDTA